MRHTLLSRFSAAIGRQQSEHSPLAGVLLVSAAQPTFG